MNVKFVFRNSFEPLLALPVLFELFRKTDIFISNDDKLIIRTTTINFD